MGEEAIPIVYWAPGEELGRYITGFHRYCAPSVPGGYRDAFFPGWASIRLTLEQDRDWSVRLGNRMIDPVPQDAFFGPSSSAGYITTYGGTIVGVGIKPFGWAQLFGGDIARPEGGKQRILFADVHHLIRKLEKQQIEKFQIRQGMVLSACLETRSLTRPAP